MRVLDLFAGLGGWSAAAIAEGHDVRTLDLDPAFGTTYVVDILDVTAATFGDWRPDLVLASPPCEAFSVLRIGHNWTRDGAPRNDKARLAVELVAATLRLIAELGPSWWVIENPRAKLRRLPVMADLDRRTVTYCQFGHPTQKPTDLWGGFPDTLRLRPMCQPLAPCHISAPAGSRTGIQGASGFRAWYEADVERLGTRNKADLAAMRSLVPYELGAEVLHAAERGTRPAALPDLDRMRYQSALWPALDAT